MSTPQVTKDSLDAISSMLGFPLGDAEVEAILPQLQSSNEAMARLDSLNLKDVEPAVSFAPQTE